MIGWLIDWSITWWVCGRMGGSNVQLVGLSVVD